MDKYLKCESCGAVIDTETGETHIGKDSNANKFKTLTEKYENIQGDLKRALEENEKLLERIKGHGKNGKGKEPGEGPGEENNVSGNEGDSGKGIW